jgi:hypothetical protein
VTVTFKTWWSNPSRNARRDVHVDGRQIGYINEFANEKLFSFYPDRHNSKKYTACMYPSLLQVIAHIEAETPQPVTHNPEKEPMLYKYTKDELVEKLESLIGVAAKYDQARAVAHEKAEQAFAKDAKKAIAKLATAAKGYDYKQLAELANRWQVPEMPTVPACPKNMVPSVEKALRQVQASNQAKFSIPSDSTMYRSVVYVLEYDWNPNPSADSPC